MSTTPTGKWNDFAIYSRRCTVGNSRFCNPNTKCFCIENFKQSQLALPNDSGSTEAFPAFPLRWYLIFAVALSFLKLPINRVWGALFYLQGVRE